MTEINKDIETVGELIEILKQYPSDYELRIFAVYDGDYYAGGYINKLKIDGETVDLFND